MSSGGRWMLTQREDETMAEPKPIPAIVAMVFLKTHLDLVRIEDDPEEKAFRLREVERLTPDAFGVRAAHLELRQPG